MNEYEMACEVRKRIEQFGKIIDGVYIFNMGGKFGTVKNYQQDEEHWEVMFDNLTHEQVIEVFEGAGTCKQEDHGWSTEGDHARVWLTCGHDCIVETVADLPNFCPNCGRRIIDQDARVIDQDARDLRDAIATDDGRRYSMQEVMEIMEDGE